MQSNPNILTLRGSRAALAAILAATALVGCSQKPAAGEHTPAPSVTVTETSPDGSIRKMDATKSFGKILFAANTASNKNHDLFQQDLHTGKVINLTNTPDRDELNPQLSPDGKYAVYAGTNDAGNYQIYRVDLASKQIKQLTNHDANDFDPTYTPQGNILYKSNADDGYGDIWKMNDKGGEQRNLTPDMDRTEEWKPTAIDENRVVFTSRHADDGSKTRAELAATDELMLLDTSLKDAQPKRLTNNTWPDWYSESDPKHPGTIAYTSKESADGQDAIFEMDVTKPDAEKQRTLLIGAKALSGDSSDCSWAPDGTLLFANNANDHYQAMARTPQGSIYTIASSNGDVLSPIAAGDIQIE